MDEKKYNRKQTAQQKLNNFLRSSVAQEYPLCSSRRLILHALASYCYYKDECDPSIPSLMNYTQLADSCIRKNLQDLQSLGLIKIIQKKGCRNKYQWLIPYMPDEEIYRKKPVNKSGKSMDKLKTPPVGGGVTAPVGGGVTH